MKSVGNANENTIPLFEYGSIKYDDTRITQQIIDSLEKLDKKHNLFTSYRKELKVKQNLFHFINLGAGIINKH